MFCAVTLNSKLGTGVVLTNRSSVLLMGSCLWYVITCRSAHLPSHKIPGLVRVRKKDLFFSAALGAIPSCESFMQVVVVIRSRGFKPFDHNISVSHSSDSAAFSLNFAVMQRSQTPGNLPVPGTLTNSLQNSGVMLL